MALFEQHIKETWSVLRRHSLNVSVDEKVTGDRSFLYVPPHEDLGAIKAKIAARQEESRGSGRVEVRRLSGNIRTDEHGLLYLPDDYVVPGGRFNEMYGWDSYWIVLGLLQDGFKTLAKQMTTNCFYQIEHYGGKVLNANRSYYLERSHPPLLAPMVKSVAAALEGTERTNFLKRAAVAMDTYYRGFWDASRRTAHTGLFQYGNSGQNLLGPCPEVVFGERDPVTQQSHYDKLVMLLQAMPVQDAIRQRFYDPATNSLTPEAYGGDRAMRESGFDPSMHFGFYGLETPDFNPICLNSLLYIHCRTLERLYDHFDQRSQARYYGYEAATLNNAIQRYCLNSNTGLFADYNHRKKQISDFPFLTSAYPLWAGIATVEQAEAFRDNLSRFETPHGLMMTSRVTGCHWNGPYMWAPGVHIAVRGMDNYEELSADARRVAGNFLRTIKNAYATHGNNFEKYNGLDGGVNTHGVVKVGYDTNVIGFGWTNGVAQNFAKWLAMPSPERRRGLRLSYAAISASTQG